MEKNEIFTAAGRIFFDFFNKEEVKNIEFDTKWMNSSGYIDYATNVPLQPGEMRKCLDDLGRRVILVGTRFGTVAVFDRFANQEKGGFYVINIPRSKVIKSLIGSFGEVGEREMLTILGRWDGPNDNIGFTIEAMAKEFA